ncbi:hypothetical protein GCM10010277_82320 [Streptomyces longisporoflavus]|uniref:hypothetical protein n=1 Tax=Streptomyces longisporoflavus TaxID=28044 RepID=UPI0019C0D6DE|nr:hypothetical protein [Streptomyces longisporoflavus]GGV70916.1 hypothetical protein GCM10010277_82320 [Streptomyces longisporoflavus]
MAESKGRPKKKFKPAGAQLVQGLLAGADDVANRSWIGGGQGTPDVGRDSAPAAPAVDEARPSSPPRAPQPRGGEDVTPQAAVTVADPVPAPAAEREPQPDDSATDPPGTGARTGAGAEAGSGGGAEAGGTTGTRAKKASTAKKSAASAAPRRNAPSANGAGERAPATAAPRDERAARDVPPAPTRSRRQQEAAPGEALAAVRHSFMDAKLHAGAWQAFGFRITPDVLALLKERVNADRRTSGNAQLAIGHYLDAALRLVPGDMSELISLATEFAMQRIWDTEKAQPSTYRVGPDAYEWIANLNVALQEAGFGRKGTYIVSVIVLCYLDMLASDGPLQRPERRRNSP